MRKPLVSLRERLTSLRVAHRSMNRYRASCLTVLAFMREDPKAYAIVIALAVVVGVFDFVSASVFIPAIVAHGREGIGIAPPFVQRITGAVSPLTNGLFLAALILMQTAIAFYRESFFVARLARWRTQYSIDYLRSIIASDWSGFRMVVPGEVEVMLTRNIGFSMKIRQYAANLVAASMLSAMYIAIILVLEWHTVFLFVLLGGIFVLLHALTLRWRMHFAVLAKERYVDVARRTIEHFADPRSMLVHHADVFLDRLRRPLEQAAHAQKRNDQLNIFFLNIHQPVIIMVLLIAASAFYALGESSAMLASIFYLFYRAAPHIVNSVRNYGEILGCVPIDVVPEIAAWTHRAPPRKGGVSPEDGGIVVRHADVGYHPGVPLLHDVNVTVSPGELVCVRGKSGTGKSTILDVVCGFITPQRGTVCLGGIDSRALDWSAWRAQLGLLRPEGVVVSGTWVENVAFLEDHPDAGRVRRLLADVGLLEHVETVAGGIEVPIAARGADLSAGQRQRLLLARALYRDPRLLILDEPTSNLDQKTEEEIHDLLLRLKGSRAMVVVTHRDRVLAYADRIYEVTTGGTVRTVAV